MDNLNKIDKTNKKDIKISIVAGTPGAGKTSVLIHTIKNLINAGHKPAVV